jgi:hypothetical protein
MPDDFGEFITLRLQSRHSMPKYAIVQETLTVSCRE